MKRFLLFLIFALGISAGLQAKTLYTPQDSLRVVQLLRQAPKGAEPIYFARQLLGVPYVGATLERDLHTEPLVVNMRELDCTTIVEVVAALWHTHRDIAAGETTAKQAFATYCRWLERYRYWDGRRDGYCSRHHYFSWWWHDNIQQGLLSEVLLEHEGINLTPLTVKLNYMSQNPEKYRQLAAHPEWVKRLKPLEQQYSGRDGYYLSQEELRRIGSAALRQQIHEGDIIAIVTKKGGLDYSHLGFASWHKDGRLHLLNASSLHKKVVDEPKTLYQYLTEHPSSIGIRVFRMQ